MIIKDLTKDIVCKTIKEIYEENNRDISIIKLFRLVEKKLGCSLYNIRKICGNFSDVLKELDINIPRNKREKIRDINNEIIYETTKKIYSFNKDISCTKLFQLVSINLNCSLSLIKNRFGNFGNILKELNINIPKNYFSLETKNSIKEGMRNSEKFQENVHSDKWKKAVYSEERGRKISDGQKKSEKFQRYIHSEKHSKNISEGLMNSKKFQIAVRSKERGEKISKAVKKDFSLEDIKQNMQNKQKYEGPFSINEFRNDKHRSVGFFVIKRSLKENDITLEEIAKNNNIELIDKRKINRWHGIGKNEKNILDSYQRELGLPIERQFPVGKYKLDGYVKKIKMPIEVDEKHHFDKNGNLKIKDIIRENIIKSKLDCDDFTRIKDNRNLTDIINNKQNSLSDFK